MKEVTAAVAAVGKSPAWMFHPPVSPALSTTRRKPKSVESMNDGTSKGATENTMGDVQIVLGEDIEESGDDFLALLDPVGKDSSNDASKNAPWTLRRAKALTDYILEDRTLTLHNEILGARIQIATFPSFHVLQY